MFRWIYGGWLVALVIGIAYLSLFNLRCKSHVEEIAQEFLDVFIPGHFILLFLLTPVMTAGVITDEKSRGTLQHLLTTDLASFYIIVGKLLGRLAQLNFLLLTGLPLFCFFGAIKGAELPMFMAICLVTLVWVFFLGAAGLLASVWTTQTRDAILGLQVILAAIMLGDYFTLGALGYLNPLHVVSCGWWAHVGSGEFYELWQRLFWFILVWTTQALPVWL